MRLQTTKIQFPEQHYMAEPTAKSMIVLHHSAGWDNARGMFTWWLKDKYKSVACAYGIQDNGEIFQGFDTSFWGYALHVASPTNNIPQRFKTANHDKILNAKAIQLEICNWGALTEKGGKFFSWANAEVPESKVVYYQIPYKGYHFYEKYTDEEIRAVENILRFHHEEDGIPLIYRPQMWNVSEKALMGTPGIWTHTSFRSDKSDCHPQPELIQMLQTICKTEF